MKALFDCGSEVICVDSKGSDPQLIEGKKYVIQMIRRLNCCGSIAVNVGIPLNKNKYSDLLDCSVCGKENPTNGNTWYRQNRFVKVEDNHALEEQIHQAMKGNLIEN